MKKFDKKSMVLDGRQVTLADMRWNRKENCVELILRGFSLKEIKKAVKSPHFWKVFERELLAQLH